MDEVCSCNQYTLVQFLNRELAAADEEYKGLKEKLKEIQKKLNKANAESTKYQELKIIMNHNSGS